MSEGKLYDTDTPEHDIAAAVDRVLNPDGSDTYKFVIVVLRPPPDSERDKPKITIEALVCSNLPFATTDSADVARLLRQASDQIKRGWKGDSNVRDAKGQGH